MFKVSDYDYYLPEELIAQEPLEKRDNSKLMILDKKNKTIVDKNFYNIIDYLNKGDVLVLNNTKVIPARLIGYKETGGALEIFLLKRISLDTWECLIKPAKKLKKNNRIIFGNGEIEAELQEIKEDGNRIIKFYYEGIFEEILDKFGNMPIPPYIKTELKEKERYQTVYAKKGESVAAPTAGLHFTNELLDKIKEKGIEIVEVCLEVGLGTFRPVKTEDVKEHKMHSEIYEITPESAQKINNAKKEGRRVIAVGTTSVRTLESGALSQNEVKVLKGETEIFIYPGYEFKIVDGLITNFHLPKSTLLMLVSAFSDKDFIFDAYTYAIKEKYRFFSFGDAMFIY